MNQQIFILCCLLMANITNLSAGDAKLALSSSAFASGQSIPMKYTCQGDDMSPALRWEGTPAGTRTFALICDDPDAPSGSWIHWILFNLPASATALDENTPKTEVLPNGAQQGENSFGRVGYGGPCPPSGKAHRYYFRLYALDASLPLKGSPQKAAVLRAMQGHILAQGDLMGRYQRQ